MKVAVTAAVQAANNRLTVATNNHNNLHHQQHNNHHQLNNNNNNHAGLAAGNHGQNSLTSGSPANPADRPVITIKQELPSLPVSATNTNTPQGTFLR